MAEVTGRSPSRRRLLLRVLPLGTVVPAVFICIALVQQGRLGEAMRHGWLLTVLAFVVGALTLVLPRRFPLLASLVAVVVFAGVSTTTDFDAITLMFFVVAGFFFGLCVRTLLLPAPEGLTRRREEPGS